MTQSPDLAPQMFRPYTVDAGTFLIAPEGLLLKELVVGVTATSMDIQDPLEGHLAVFAQGDIVRVRAPGYLQSAQQDDSATIFAHEFWAVGAVPSTAMLDVWLKVTAVNDMGTHFRYTARRRGPASSDQYIFPSDTLVIGYGPADNRLLELRATRDRTPHVDIFTTGDAPWNGTKTQVRLGRLDGLGAIGSETYGLATGANLNATGSAHTRISEQGVHLSQLDLTLDAGGQNTVKLGGSGALKVGPDVGDPDGVDLTYDPPTRKVHVRSAEIVNAQIANTQIVSAQIENVRINDAEVSGSLIHKGDLRINNADLTTIALSATGQLKAGADVSDPDSVDLAYDPPTRTVHIRTAQIGNAQISDGRFENAQLDNAQIEKVQLTTVEVNGGLTSQGDITLANNGATTVKLASNGDVQFGSDLEPASGLLFDLQTGTGTLAIAAVTTLQKDVTFVGSATFQADNVNYGSVRLQTGDVVKARIDPTGGFSLGPDVNLPDSVDLNYDPTSRRVEIRDAQIRNAQIADAEVIDIEVSGSLSGHGEIRLAGAEAETVRLSSNGDVQFGPNLGQAGGALFDLQSDAGALALHAMTTFHGKTIFQANARFDGRATLKGDIVLEGETTAFNTIRLVENGALVVGKAESIRMDQDGITLRLEPGEHNSVQVLGIGRAAMLNAYQTAKGVQQFDMLAYYSDGVPSLNGRLMMGVASVDGGDPDLYMRMTRYFSGVRRVDIQASLLDIQSSNIQLTGATSINGNFEFSGTTSPDRTFRLRNLPTKSDGLPSGSVWNNQGTLNIVP